MRRRTAPRPLDDAARRFRMTLLRWYARAQRDLPWRGSPDPYAVLVSEIMLQQTQVLRVRDYWTRFMTRFPTLTHLASASLDDVHDHWAGLGYYARARNLHATAQVVVADHGGALPRDLDALRRLPGIGRYTAAAVASLGFGIDVATVDTNIDRVLGRVFGVRAPAKSAARAKRIWALAERLVPRGRSSDWNQALMDLGATICTARAPRCPACPVRRVCRSVPKRGRGRAPSGSLAARRRSAY
jgi:A/G-specific adenine glycosylase